MKLNGYKKLLLLGIILLIIAGIVVVALKGVNVSLYLHQHESVVVKIGKETNLNDVNEICKSVFQNKKYLVKEVELFKDSVDVVVESITDEEKEELVNKLNEKYGVELTVNDLIVRDNSNIRIRDIVTPYVFPTITSVVLIGVIYVIVYRKKEIILKYIKSLGIVVITEALIASVVAIVRIPVTTSLIPLMLFVAITEIIFYMNKNK